MNDVKSMYACCFCGKNIESGQIDVCSFVMVSNYDKDDALQESQQFFCHIDCFKDTLHKNVPLVIGD